MELFLHMDRQVQAKLSLSQAELKGMQTEVLSREH